MVFQLTVQHTIFMCWLILIANLTNLVSSERQGLFYKFLRPYCPKSQGCGIALLLLDVGGPCVLLFLGK